METECTYDYLFVYDGDSYQSPLLASLSGNTLPQPIEAKSGKVRPKVSVYTICATEPVSLTFQRIKIHSLSLILFIQRDCEERKLHLRFFHFSQHVSVL